MPLTAIELAKLLMDLPAETRVLVEGFEDAGLVDAAIEITTQRVYRPGIPVHNETIVLISEDRS